MYVRYIMLAMACTVVYSYSMKEEEFGKIVADLTQKTLAILAKKETIAKLKNSTPAEESKQKIATDIESLMQEVNTLDTQLSMMIKQILQKAEVNDLQKNALEDLWVCIPTNEATEAPLEN